MRFKTVTLEARLNLRVSHQPQFVRESCLLLAERYCDRESVSCELEGKDLAGGHDEGSLDPSLSLPTGATAHCKVIRDAVKFSDT